MHLNYRRNIFDKTSKLRHIHTYIIITPRTDETDWNAIQRNMRRRKIGPSSKILFCVLFVCLYIFFPSSFRFLNFGFCFLRLVFFFFIIILYLVSLNTIVDFGRISLKRTLSVSKEYRAEIFHNFDYYMYIRLCNFAHSWARWRALARYVLVAGVENNGEQFEYCRSTDQLVVDHFSIHKNKRSPRYNYIDIFVFQVVVGRCFGHL